MDEIIEAHSQNPELFSKKKISRRTFLKRMGQLAAGLYATIAFGKSVHAQPDTNTSSPAQSDEKSNEMASATTKNPRPPEQLSAPKEVADKGVKIFYGVDNLPTHYILPDGTDVQLDSTKLLEAKEKALKNKEIEFVDIIAAPELEDNSYEPSAEHPVLNEISSDALSKEELAKRGVEIIQSPQVEFFVRKRAFEQGGTLAQYLENGDKKLKIVLVDSVVVAAPFMTDPRYAEVVDYVKDPNFSKKDLCLKPNFVQNFKVEQEKLITKLKEQSNSAYAKEQLKNAKALLYKIDHLPQNDVMKLLTELTSPNGGLYIPRYVQDYPFFVYPQKSKETPNTAVLFMAVGNSVLPKEEIKLFFDEEGKFQVTLEKTNSQSAMPSEKDSMPNPEKYTFNPNSDEFDGSSYAYQNRDVVLRVYHEGEHGVKSEEALDLDEVPDTNEFRTDLGAGRRIKKVYNKWAKSGFTDDSESSFGFRLRNGKVIIFKSNSPSPVSA